MRAIGLVAALWFPTVLHAGPLHEYRVKVGTALERLSVEACFDGQAPAELVAESEAASLYLRDVRVRHLPAAKVVASGERMVLPAIPPNSCLDYQVLLQPAQGGAQSGGGPETRRVGADLLTSIGDWLWRPSALGEGEDVSLRFELPAGVSVSAPWKRVDDGAYRLGSSPPNWPAVVAFGQFRLHTLQVPGGVLELALIDGPATSQHGQLVRWIEDAARAVSTAYGRFPVPRLQVIVAPTSRGQGPVPWAYVARGGGPAVHFFINPERAPDEFARDWSAVHEMSHLFLPYVSSRDIWLYEGLATYMQNVLMARGGLITKDEAWRRLYTGFQRASRIAPGATLQQAAERLNRPNNYLRPYWGGAALLLEADLRLREQGASLEAALAGLACCLDTPARVPADDIVTRLDAATGGTVFRELQQRAVKSPEFPEFDSLFARLGVDVFGGEVRYTDDPQAQRLREGILSPR